MPDFRNFTCTRNDDVIKPDDLVFVRGDYVGLEPPPQNDKQIEIRADLTPILGPTLDQYLGPWYMLESHFMQQVQVIQSVDLTAHIKHNAATQAKQAEKPFEVIRDNIARIDIEGTMTKRGSSFGPPGTIAIRRQVRAALNDPEISGIFLRIDSPGGTAAGTKDLADDVFRATKTKPVMAFIEDTGASAAYYVASQATVTKSNASAVVGSIGTVLVVMDMSELAAKEGIKVHVISTGPFKGAGAPGSKVSETHLAYFQDIIDRGNELFLQDVHRGTSLSMSQVRQLADGRVHMAAQAVELGLIDGITGMDEAVDELVQLSSSRRSVSMSSDVPRSATLQELKAAFPEASSDFVLEQLEAGATIEVATKAHAAKLQADLTAARAEAEEAKQAAAAARKEAEEAKQASQLPGNSVEEEGSGYQSAKYATATEQWKDEIQTLCDNGMDRLQAVVKVDRDNPGLREKYLAEYTPQPNRKAQPAA